MLKIYLDNCCYSRPFDDVSQDKIQNELAAIEAIFRKHINKELEIYKSLAIDYEISKIKNDVKRRQVEDLFDVIDAKEIEYSKKIKTISTKLRKYNIKTMDSLHLAFAEYACVDFFITTDKLLINASKRVDLNVEVMSPIEFIMEVG